MASCFLEQPANPGTLVSSLRTLSLTSLRPIVRSSRLRLIDLGQSRALSLPGAHCTDIAPRCRRPPPSLPPDHDFDSRADLGNKVETPLEARAAAGTTLPERAGEPERLPLGRFTRRAHPGGG